MSLIAIRAAGPGVTIQDGGRRGFLRFGVTGAGPMDPLAFAAANQAVGNDRDATAIEVSTGGLAIACKRAALDIAVAGGEFVIRRDGQVLPSALRLTLRPGEVLEITSGGAGNWCYLAIGGCVDLPKVLGSHATHTRTGLGGIEGRALRAGDEIPVSDARSFGFDEGALIVPWPDREEGRIRVIAGPQRDYFADDQFRAFVTEPWTVSTKGDRMAAFLKGPLLTHAKGYNIVSDGITRGAIQVPGEGSPIILMADRQPTGGYPKIATIITADLGVLAQMRGGETFTFVEVSHEEAVEALRAQEAALTAIAARPFLRTTFTAEFFDTHPLLDGIVEQLPSPEGLAPADRIKLLFDQDSAQSREAGTVIVAQGHVFGRPVLAYARGAGPLGTVEAEAIAGLYRQAAEASAIVVALHDGTALEPGHVSEGLTAVARIAEAGGRQRMPELALVPGRAVGVDALLVSLADLVFAVDGTELALAGSDFTHSIRGLATIEEDTVSSRRFANEVEAIVALRRLVDLLHEQAQEPVALAQPWPAQIDPRADIRELIGALADRSEFFELQAGSAPGVVTAIARIGGLSCGVLANQLSVNGGVMHAPVLRKAEGFVRLCSRLSMPLLHLSGTPGILPGEGSLAAARDFLRALLRHEAGLTTLGLTDGGGLVPALATGTRLRMSDTEDPRAAIMTVLSGGKL